MSYRKEIHKGHQGVYKALNMNGNTDNTSMRPEGEGRERRSYPFEHKQERRLYPFERKNESGIKDGDE